MSPGSLFLCVPYTMSATRWETEGYPHTHMPTVCKDLWMEIAESLTHSDYYLCGYATTDSGTARYQYHLYREQNIVGPTWPGRRESRSLARWQLAR